MSSSVPMVTSGVDSLLSVRTTVKNRVCVCVCVCANLYPSLLHMDQNNYMYTFTCTCAFIKFSSYYCDQHNHICVYLPVRLVKFSVADAFFLA